MYAALGSLSFSVNQSLLWITWKAELLHNPTPWLTGLEQHENKCVVSEK